MEKLKAALKSYFAGYEAHQEHSGTGAGKPAVTTDDLAELIVNARATAGGAIGAIVQTEVPGEPAKPSKLTKVKKAIGKVAGKAAIAVEEAGVLAVKTVEVGVIE